MNKVVHENVIKNVACSVKRKNKPVEWYEIGMFFVFLGISNENWYIVQNNITKENIFISLIENV